MSSAAPLEIDVTELDAWRKAGRDVAVLDVREDWEVATVALEGAKHIPMRQVPERVAELPKDRPLVVMCHHGGRSRQVTGWLRQNGFPQAINLAGGIHAWAEQIDPSMAKY
ncbi:rhodanese-like domain-containing protein [uncultured Ferrovibrio sp.]|jgi:rhodanese-related sulfurtransferase|uniref:rhodanese-like domain-containing protein n=1 Tax=uncultured Ferrovibrio sp. TaxID=1576913 RepID=UPI00261AAEE8|nr:rhodanese-like domain-containing protein [uncultured Ferrovibrio sp.]